jgi:hypothetical protein
VERGDLAHKLIAIARQAFERFAQHCRCLVSFGRFEEADAMVVRIADQARKLLLTQRCLHRTAVRPGSKRQSGNFHF